MINYSLIIIALHLVLLFTSHCSEKFIQQNMFLPKLFFN